MNTAEIPSQTFLWKGNVVHFKTVGTGTPLVLLPGFLEDISMFDSFLDALAELPVQAIMVDLPGHGKSDVVASTQTMELMANMVHDLLQHLHVPACLMLGHSMGGYVTLAFAEKFPEQLLGLCLLHSHGRADSPQKQKDRMRAVKVIRMNPKVFVNEAIPNLFAPDNRERCRAEIEQIKAVAMQTDPEGIEACLRGMAQRPDRTAVYKNFSRPKTLIAGDQDPVLPLEWLPAHFDATKNPAPEVLSCTGHMGFVESPIRCMLFVSGWIRNALN